MTGPAVCSRRLAGGRILATAVARPETDLVATRLWLRGGTRAEEIPGQAVVSGRLLSEGTSARSWDWLALDAEKRGAVVSSYATIEGHGVTIDAMASDLGWSIRRTSDLVTDFGPPEERFEVIRSQVAGELKSAADQPEVVTGWSFLQQLYGEHPLGRPPSGTHEGLARLQLEDCRRFHAGSQSRGGVLVVVSSQDVEVVLDELERQLEGLGGEATADGELETPTRAPGVRRDVEIPSGDQVHVCVGHLTVDRCHVDVPVLQVLSVILGASSGLSGRFPTRLREERGLAYTVQTHCLAGAGTDPGRFFVYLATHADLTEEALEAIREEVRDLCERGVSEEEVEDAKSYLIGRDPFRRETARQWADLVAEGAFYELPIHRRDWRMQRIAPITRQEVNRTIVRHLHPEALQTTVGRPPA